jgi:hypothetical protein
MGTTVNNNHNSDGTGVAVLGIVAVVAIAGIIAVVVAALTVILIGVTAAGTAVLAYKCYQLRVYRTVALAAIQANMSPPTFQPERKLPTAQELMMGRNHEPL